MSGPRFFDNKNNQQNNNNQEKKQNDQANIRMPLWFDLKTIKESKKFNLEQEQKEREESRRQRHFSLKNDRRPSWYLLDQNSAKTSSSNTSSEGHESTSRARKKY